MPSEERRRRERPVWPPAHSWTAGPVRQVKEARTDALRWGPDCTHAVGRRNPSLLPRNRRRKNPLTTIVAPSRCSRCRRRHRSTSRSNTARYKDARTLCIHKDAALVRLPGLFASHNRWQRPTGRWRHRRCNSRDLIATDHRFRRRQYVARSRRNRARHRRVRSSLRGIRRSRIDCSVGAEPSCVHEHRMRFEK